MKGPGGGFPPWSRKSSKMAGGNLSQRGAGATAAILPPALGGPQTIHSPPHGEVCAACDWLSWAQRPCGGRGRHAAATFPAPLVRSAIPTGKRSRASPPRPPARASAPSPFRVGLSRQRSSKHRGQQRAVRTQFAAAPLAWKMPPDGGLGLQLR